MKKLLTVFSLVLAINFLAVAAGVGFLFKGGHLDKSRIAKIKEIVFPPAPTVAPVTRPSSTTRPVVDLDQLLARHAGRTPTEQLHHIRQSFDAHMLELERKQREMLALKVQADAAQAAARAERALLEKAKAEFAAREKAAVNVAEDKAFQDSLALYTTMPAKQTKSLFLGLDDETAVKYLSAMEPRTAAKITKEFKSPEEIERLKKIMEKLRQAPAEAPANPQASVKE